MTTAKRRSFSSCSSPPAAVVQQSPLDRRQREPGWNEPSDALCHNLCRPRPGCRRLRLRRLCDTSAAQQQERQQWDGRRSVRIRSRSWIAVQTMLLALVFGLLVCCQGVGAQGIHVAEPWEGMTELVFDRSEPPARPMQLRARQETSTARSLPTIVSATTSSGHVSASSTATDSQTLNTATPTAQSILPRPFDTSLGDNFTSPSCPAFFTTFLNNDTFNACLPLSLLLQTSNSFFAAERTPVLLTQTLTTSCSVSYPLCSTLMSSLATQLTSPTACGADLTLQNPMVLQAYNGFLAYPTLYHAGCLTNPQTGNYCFADAVTNASAPTGSYIYYLPLGMSMPTGSRVGCSKCLQQTMAIFAEGAGNSSEPLSGVYAGAAEMIDGSCGSQFVEEMAQRTNGAASLLPARSYSGLGLVTLIAVVLGLVV